jgi:hypothetical protein
MGDDRGRDLSPEVLREELAATGELDDEARLTLLQDIHAHLESSLDEGVEPTDDA